MPAAKSPPRAPRQSVASITTVAERAGVSIATVSRIVNGVAKKASAETIARVKAAIAELGYRPVSVGRALRQRQSRLVALLAANLANPAMAAIAAAAEVALRNAGLVMVLCDTHDVPELQDEYLLEMRAQLARSIVLLGPVALRRAGLVMVLCDTHDVPALQDEYLLEMRAQLARAIVMLGPVASTQLAAFRDGGETMLFVNRRCPGGARAPFVGIDNRAAGRDVAAFFARRAVQPLGVIHGDMTSSATADRITAFRASMAAAGRPLRDGQVVTEAGSDHLEIGYRAMARLLAGRERPRGLFCASDLIAYGAARRAREAGLAVPEDLTIVGFDDNPLNDWVAPWLSSVRVPYERYGDAIVAALQEGWAGAPRAETILAHELIVRPRMA